MEDRKDSPPEKSSADDSSNWERIDELVKRGHLIYESVDSTELEADVEIQKTIVTKVGQQLSHYRIIQKLGEGGMGVVYLAVDTKLDRRVAIKILPDFSTANQEGLKRFIREAKTASSV